MAQLNLLSMARPNAPLDRDRAAHWTDQAACAGLDTDAWYPPTSGPTAYDIARAICLTCPVRTVCLQAALEEENDAPSRRYGMRGGLTPDERQAYSLTGVDPTGEPARAKRPRPRHSSKREAGLALLAAGRPASAVARELGCSVETVYRWRRATERPGEA